VTRLQKAEAMWGAAGLPRLKDFVAKAGDFSCKWGGLICWNGPYHPPFEGVGITDWC